MQVVGRQGLTHWVKAIMALTIVLLCSFHVAIICGRTLTRHGSALCYPLSEITMSFIRVRAM